MVSIARRLGEWDLPLGKGNLILFLLPRFVLLENSFKRKAIDLCVQGFTLGIGILVN